MAGGVVAVSQSASISEPLGGVSAEKIQQSLSRLGTMDLRTDFLSAGRGEAFIATAQIIRSGNKIAVAGME